MKEIVVGEHRTVTTDLAGPALAAMRDLDAAVGRRSQIVWAEHCTECAYPQCYTSCSQYTPRLDLHCRRFVAGIEAVRAPGLRSPLMRVQFRRWGKLEGSGPAPLRRRPTAAGVDAVQGFVGALADFSPLPYRLRDGTRRVWVRAEHLARRGADASRADAFVVECVSASDRAVPFTLSVVPEDGSPGAFRERLVMGGGYARHVVPVSVIAARVDLSRPFVVQIEPLIESSDPFLFGFVDFVEWADGPAPSILPRRATPVPERPASRAKCVVWDLDDTLWDGILAEVGFEGLRLRENVVAVLRALDARGVLHSVASKNDETEALAALDRFGIGDLFLHPQVGYAPKSDSVQRIARELDIGVDTLAFVDDQPFERSQVGETLPCVTVFSHTDAQSFLTHPLFDVPVTAESPRRRQMYRDEIRRGVALAATRGEGSDYRAFLRSCDIRLNLSLLTAADVERIVDLSQRTNQVNVTGTRYEHGQVLELAKLAEHARLPWLAEPARQPRRDSGSPSRLPIVLRCEDRFGDYGVVGFVLLDPAEGVVVDYFMSCRVQRKGVDSALFGHIAKIVAASGGSRLACRYRRTERNALSLELLGAMGFRLRESEPGAGFLERDLGPVPDEDVVRVGRLSVGDSKTGGPEAGGPEARGPETGGPEAGAPRVGA